MITSNDFRPGVTIEIDGQVWQVVEFQHVKPGKGAAFVRAKIKNLETGAVVERTWNAGEKVQEVALIAVRCNTSMNRTECTYSWTTNRMNRLSSIKTHSARQ